jgi:hypothetical protein
MKNISVPNTHGIELAETTVKDQLKLKYKMIPFVPERILPPKLRSVNYHASCMVFIRSEIFVRSKSIHKAFSHVFSEPIEKCEIILANSQILANRYFFESKDDDLKELIVVFVVSTSDYNDAVDEFDADKFNFIIKDPEPHSSGWALGIGS